MFQHLSYTFTAVKEKQSKEWSFLGTYMDHTFKQKQLDCFKGLSMLLNPLLKYFKDRVESGSIYNIHNIISLTFDYFCRKQQFKKVISSIFPSPYHSFLPLSIFFLHEWMMGQLLHCCSANESKGLIPYCAIMTLSHPKLLLLHLCVELM